MYALLKIVHFENETESFLETIFPFSFGKF